MPRALLSVFDKTGIIELARGLVDRGFDLVSTGGTARALVEAGLDVTSVSDLTGFPEMLDGRVKTLHPAVHGGILARRDHPDDLQAIAGLGIQPIDVVVVNLYPFAQTAKQEGLAFDDLVEQIDIGGPSLVRAAAKNFRDVLIVVDPGDYPIVLSAIADGPGLGVSLSADVEGLRPHRRVRQRRLRRRWRRSRWTAIDSTGRRLPRRPRRRCSSRSRRFAICATARTRTSTPPGTVRRRRGCGTSRRPADLAPRPSFKARSSRTPICSTSTPRRVFCSNSTSRPRW